MEKTSFRDTAAFKILVLAVLAAAVAAAFIIGNIVGTMDISVSDIIETIS